MSSDMEVEIISRENIKPTSPTPRHLRTHKLSLLDQIMFPIYYPVFLYFHAQPPSTVNNLEFISGKIQLLKHSLSSCLTRYYPFAGIITDRLSVHCNDEGLPFAVARVKKCTLSDFLQQPIADLLVKQSFLQEEKTERQCVLKIQVNFFDCGGLAIGINFLHNVADGTTLFAFLKDWSLIAQHGIRQEDVIITPPVYMGHSVFPQITNLPEDKKWSFGAKDYIRMAKFVGRRCVFDELAISKLKAKSSSSEVESPTRVEAVSALIWKCFMVALESSGSSSTYTLMHAVNVRRRAVPPLPANCFGNLIWHAPATHNSDEEEETEQTNLVKKIRESITKIDHDSIKKMQCKDGMCLGYYEIFEEAIRTPKEAEVLTITSWCRFGIYDVDFGWGRPIWVSNYALSDSESPMLNTVVLKDTRSGDGIEALVALEEKYISEFENNKELQAFASIDLSLCDK